MPPKFIPQVYAKVFGKNLTFKNYHFTGVENMLDEIDIFSRDETHDVVISRQKLLKYLLGPLCDKPDSTITPVAFIHQNGFSDEVLCRYCSVGSLDDLVDEFRSEQEHGFYIDRTNPAIPRGPVAASLATKVHSQPDHPSQPLYGPPPTGPPYGPPLTGPPMPFSATPVMHHQRFMTPPPAFPPVVQQPVPLFPPRSPSTSDHTHPPPSLSPALPQPPSPQLLLNVKEPKASKKCQFPNNDTPPQNETYLPAGLSEHPRTEVPKPQHPPPRPMFNRREKSAKVMEKIETYIDQFINCYSSQSKHLPLDIVTREVKDVARRAQYESGIQIRWNETKCWKEYDLMYKRVDEFFHTFCWNCANTTLYELERCICEFEKREKFDDFRQGPLLKHPTIRDLFNVPSDVKDVPRITAYDIRLHINEFINRSKKGTQHTLEDFLQYLVKEYNVPSAEHLCLRFKSFRMLISVSVL